MIRPSDRPESLHVSGTQSLPPQSLASPAGRALAFSTLLLSVLGNYYAYASLGVVTEELRAELAIGNSELGAIAAAAPALGFLVAPVAGRILDRVRVPRACLAFSLLAFVGCVLVSTGSAWQQVALGRAFFGAGAGSLLVGGTVWAAIAFPPRWNGLSQGLVSAAAALGITFAGLLPLFASEADGDALRTTLSSGLLASGIGGLALFGAALRSRVEPKRVNPANQGHGDPTEDSQHKTRHRRFFLLLTLIGFLMAAAVEPFCITFGVEYLTTVHVLPELSATLATGSIYLLLVLLAPALGSLLSSSDRRTFALVFGAVLLVLGFVALGSADAPTYLGMGTLALAYAVLTASLWPLVADLVPVAKVGVASGVLLSLMSLGTALSTLALGVLLDDPSPVGSGTRQLSSIPSFLGCAAALACLPALGLWWLHRLQRASRC